MKKVTNLIIVDASSSMESKRNEVITGLTTLLKEIKADAKKDKKVSKISTIILEFSSVGAQRVLLNSEDSLDINVELVEKYRPAGMTALFDAIGQGFRLIPLGQDAVFINIFTDGEENQSREFNQLQVRDLITTARDRKWAVTFMGTTEEALQKAEQFGVSKNNMFQFSNDSRGVEKSMKTMSLSREVYYNAAVTDNLDTKFDQLINKPKNEKIEDLLNKVKK